MTALPLSGSTPDPRLDESDVPLTPGEREYAEALAAELAAELDETSRALAAAQALIGGCREEDINGDKCWKPSEYLLWGRLIPMASLGPRCYDHAAAHVGHHALTRNSGHAVVHVAELVDAITKADA